MAQIAQRALDVLSSGLRTMFAQWLGAGRWATLYGKRAPYWPQQPSGTCVFAPFVLMPDVRVPSQ